MCGIMGWVREDSTPLTDDQVISFRGISQNLLIDISPRGKDSIGIFVEDSKLQGESIKRCLLAEDFVKSKAWEKFSLDNITKDTRLVLGHTRTATEGAITQVNAHPLNTKNFGIVGVHNGIIQNHNSIAYRENLHAYFKGGTDSIRVFAALAKALETNEKDTKLIKHMSKYLSMFEGSAALAFRVKGEKQLWLFKDGNPLNIYYDPEIKTLFFSSNMNIHINVLNKWGFNARPFTIEQEQLYNFDPESFDHKPRFLDKEETALYSHWSRTNFGPSSGYYKKQEKVIEFPSKVNFKDHCGLCHNDLEKTSYRIHKYKVIDSFNLCSGCMDFMGDLIKHLDFDSYLSTNRIKHINRTGHINKNNQKIHSSEYLKKLQKTFQKHSIACNCPKCQEAIAATIQVFNDKTTLENISD